jgi:D-3-phosphoglycerate dehydrogenase
VVTATSGFDHIDLKATAERGVTVMHTPDANAASACELTWALILACARKLPSGAKALKAGDWTREPLVGTQVSGKTLGIVGLGRIGTRVARVGQALGCRIIAFDPYLDESDFTRHCAERVGFDELLRIADIVSFHVPATTETKFMLRREGLEAMNRHAILVNASRGSVVSERDLTEALRERWIGALGLDVFEREPLPRDSKLLNFQNVVMTPHLGAATHEAFAAASREAALKLIAYQQRGEISDALPPRADWFTASFGLGSGPGT